MSVRRSRGFFKISELCFAFTMDIIRFKSGPHSKRFSSRLIRQAGLGCLR